MLCVVFVVCTLLTSGMDLIRENSSPKEYLLLVRVNAAKNMLRTQQYSVGGIALSCGFSDSPSFCHHFKKLTGRTPSQFLKELQLETAPQRDGGEGIKKGDRPKHEPQRRKARLCPVICHITSLPRFPLSMQKGRSGVLFLLFDDDIRKAAMKADKRDARFWESIDKDGKTPFAYVGQTIADVARQAGLDPQVLEKTVQTYNETAPAGKDAFGRTSLSSGFGKPLPIRKAPFVLMPATAALIATYCGVRIDPQARVIDVFGEPIKGLYAAGEMTGGVHGAAYMSGTALGKAYAFGRIAAQTIASGK